jgi:hypothetical protein
MDNNKNDSLIKGTCPFCVSEEFYRIRAKNHDYSFVLGISNPAEQEKGILPFLPVEILACAKCRRIVLETNAFDSGDDEH